MVSGGHYEAAYYQCDLCAHTTTAQTPMIHHRWVAHRQRGPVTNLRVAAVRRQPADRPRKPRTVKQPLPERPTPQAPTCTLPAVWVPSGVRHPVDIDAARARSFAEADPDILNLDFAIGHAC